MKADTSIRFVVSLLTLAVGAAFAAEPVPVAGRAAPATMKARAGLAPNEIDAQVLVRAQQKFSRALKTTHRFDSFAAQESLGDNWRHELLAHLMEIDESDFAAVESANSISDAVGTAARLAGNVKAPPDTTALLGDVSADLTYIPINPCRILDTRAGSGTSFSAGQTRTYSYNNTNTGANSSCNPNPGQYPGTRRPTAIAANVTVDETGLSGFAVGSFLAIYPQGGTAGTSFMNFGPGQVIANAGVFSINATSGQFTMLASAPAQVIVDVFGVFVAPAPTALECQDLESAPMGVAAGSYSNVTSPSCPAGYMHTGGACNADHEALSAGTIDFSSTRAYTFCFYRNTDNAAAHYITAVATCCRVPGRN